MKKRRWRAWDSNPGWQDGRRIRFVTDHLAGLIHVTLKQVNQLKNSCRLSLPPKNQYLHGQYSLSRLDQFLPFGLIKLVYFVSSIAVCWLDKYPVKQLFNGHNQPRFCFFHSFQTILQNTISRLQRDSNSDRWSRRRAR